jgi:DNA-binding transcriptional LysR family regulator
MRTNSGDTCRMAALRNQGIVLQPTFLVGPDLLAGTLVEVMPGWRSVEWASTRCTRRASSSRRRSG